MHTNYNSLACYCCIIYSLPYKIFLLLASEMPKVLYQILNKWLTLRTLLWGILENSRPLSPWGPLDSLSTCLGNDSLKCMKVKSDSEVAQWCPTFSDPIDYSLPGSSVHGIVQARVLEWGAISFSSCWSWTPANTRPPNLPLEKPICRSGSNS